MIETITLDTHKRYWPVVKQHLAPLRRGERGNVPLTVAVRRDRRPYDLAGMTAHLVCMSIRAWRREERRASMASLVRLAAMPQPRTCA